MVSAAIFGGWSLELHEDSSRHFLRARLGRKPQIRRWNFNVCHIFGDISTSVLGSHITISGFLSMSHLFADTFFGLSVVENFAFTTGITVILTLEAFLWVSHYSL